VKPVGDVGRNVERRAIHYRMHPEHCAGVLLILLNLNDIVDYYVHVVTSIDKSQTALELIISLLSLNLNINAD